MVLYGRIKTIMEVIMKYTHFYSSAVLFALLINASAHGEGATIASEVATQVAKTGWIGWIGEKLSFGSMSLGGGAVTLDSTKGSTLLVAALSSSLGWIKQNPKISAALCIYGCYRLHVDRIHNKKIKKLVKKLAAHAGSAKIAKSIDGHREEIFSTLEALASEVNLSCMSWFLSARWIPKWVPGLSSLRDTLSSSAANLKTIEDVVAKGKDGIDVEDAGKILKLFTTSGL
jgi:hypothetical protein